MPKYDFTCASGHEQHDVFVPYGTRPPCPDCGAATEILWKSSFPNVIGDEIDYVDHNIASTPIHFRSKSERRRMMKQQGLNEKIQHQPLPGTDKSPVTKPWY